MSLARGEALVPEAVAGTTADSEPAVVIAIAASMDERLRVARIVSPRNASSERRRLPAPVAGVVSAGSGDPCTTDTACCFDKAIEVQNISPSIPAANLGRPTVNRRIDAR